MVFPQSLPAPTPPMSFVQPATPERLRQINIYLDQLLLALVALTDLDESTWKQALEKSSLLGNSLAPDHPAKTAAPGEVNLQKIRSLAMMVASLSQHYHELLRRSVSLTEQTTEQGKNPLQTALLGEYAQKLQSTWNSYQVKQNLSVLFLTEDRILSLLTELFFYGSQDGPRRLWMVLENTSFPTNHQN